MVSFGQKTPTFGQDRIKDIPPLNLLDALYAQGLSQDYLRQMMGMTTPQITSFLLRGDQDRFLIDRAVRMATGEEQQQLGSARNDYEKLYAALSNRGVDLTTYNGKNDVNALAAWAGEHSNPQVVGNALATALPNQQLAGGRTVTDEDRRGVLMFSNPQPNPETGQAQPTTTRGIPDAGGPGARGQGDTRTVAPAPAAGAPNLGGATPGPTAPGPGTTGGGGGANQTPVAKPLTPDQIRADLNTKYGWAASLADIPEVQKILVDAANGVISEDEANNRWLATDYYKQTTVNERNWRILEKSSPGEAASQLQAQTTSIMQNADRQGVQIDPARARQIAETAKAHGWSDQQVNASIASEIHYDPSGAKTGVLAQIKTSQQNQLVPMSDQAMTQWAQAIVGGTKTQADFDAYIKDQAKSLFPSIAHALDDPTIGNVKHYLDPYAQTIAKQLGTNPADIDWMDPKYMRFVNQVDPKTGQRGVMNLADVSRTIVSDPQYGYDQTANGKQQKAGLARTILSQWGYIPGGTQSSGGGF